MLEEIIDACHYLLNNYSAAEKIKDYIDNRLTKESQEKFQVGYFPNTENIQALISLVGEDILIKNNLLIKREIEDSLYPRKVNLLTFEEHPLIMPYKDAYGKTIAIVGRSILSESERKVSKYKNTAFEKSKHLFGLYENKKNILNKGGVFIVEGQIDTIKALEYGLDNVVSIGSSSLSDNQFSLITRYTNNIYLLLDNDEAGEKGRKRITDRFSKYANIYNFYIPEEYKDIDEYLTKDPNKSLSFVIKH